MIDDAPAAADLITRFHESLAAGDIVHCVGLCREVLAHAPGEPFFAERLADLYAILGADESAAAGYGELLASHPSPRVREKLERALAKAPREPAVDAAELNEAFRRNILACAFQWPNMRTPVVPMERDRAVPIPDVFHRRRVQGAIADADPDGARFSSAGFEHCRAVVNLAEIYGLHLSEETRTLDWGVGCGRISRHMPPALRPGFVGIDVDPINVAWCRDNIPWGRYEVIGARARTSLDSGAFDLIYSHSVLTHLDEAHQDFWLEELARLCRPGGLLVLTVHGLRSATEIAKWARQPAGMLAFLDRGFQNAPTPNPDIADVTPAGYFRDVAHSPAYIRERWPLAGLEVIDVLNGGFGKVQDAVVCRLAERSQRAEGADGP